jgi:predicted MFS family arabinose efflux permease
MRQPWWPIYIVLAVACAALAVYTFIQPTFFEPSVQTGWFVQFVYRHFGIWGTRVLMLGGVYYFLRRANHERRLP